MPDAVQVFVQPTPNPNALKFTVNRTVSPAAKTYTTAEQAADSPLALALLRIANVQQVFFLNDFVTVSRTPEGDWNAIVPLAEAALREHLQ